MLRLAGFVIALPLCVQGQTRAPVRANLEWTNVSGTYRTFSEIKPKLVNTGDKAIYLSRLYPDSSAHLQRLNEENGEWESGEWSITCGVVANAGVPIEIKPKAERDIQVFWQLSTDDWDFPKHFVALPSRKNRQLSGKYRFTLRYALEPWTLIHHPSATYTLTSPEFVVRSE